MDRWVSKPIVCAGGLVLDIDTLTAGTSLPGSAAILQNFEPSIDGGYKKINGYTKYSSSTVPGDTSKPILGLKVGLTGVFATRKINTGTANEDNAIYFSTGTSWSAALNTVKRPGDVTKVRCIAYSISEPVIIQCDGLNPAWKYNGAVDTLINGVGAPTNPKYACLFKNRLVLAGYGGGSSISFSVPSNDASFIAADGAFEINVGDTVRGLKLFRDTLVIFCARSIKVFTGNTSADFILKDVTSSIGCVSGDSIQEIGGDLVYLSTDGFRSYAATVKIGDVDLALVSKAIQPLTRDILSLGLPEDAFSSCAIRKKSQYRLYLNIAGTEEAGTIGVLGRLTDTPITPHGTYEWATIMGVKPYCADSEYSENNEVAVIGHPTNGYVYRLESGNTFDGTNMQAIFVSQDATYDDATLRKVFHKIDLYTHIDGDVNYNVRLILDGSAEGTIQPAPLTITEIGSVVTYDSAIYDTSVYGTFIHPRYKRNLVGSGFLGAIEVTCTDSSAPFKIDAFQVHIAVKGRR